MHTAVHFPSVVRGLFFSTRACIWLRIFLLSVSLCATASVQGQTARYELVISGADEFITLLETHLDISQRSHGEPLLQEELQHLVGNAPEQARQLLATEGYFSPAIQAQIETINANWRVSLHIDLGPPTLIDQFTLLFDGAISEPIPEQIERQEALRQSWQLNAGSRFRQTDWDKEKNRLLQNLLQRDYPAAHISESEALIDPQTRHAKLLLKLDSGPAFTFGALQISGLQRYSRAMVESLSMLRTGEPYSQEKLTELQSSLQESGYFQTAFATIDVDPAHPLQVPVKLELNENARRNLALGIGFSTDVGAHLQSKWRDRRWLGHDWLLDAQVQLDRRTRLAGGEMTFPAREYGWYPSLAAHFERSDIAQEVNDKLRLDARMKSPPRLDQMVWGLSWLTENQYVATSPVNHRQALIATVSLTQRRFDDLIKPSHGYALMLEAAVGPRGLLNEAHLLRLHGLASALTPLGGRWQGALRTEFGQVFGSQREQTPSELLFRTGGDLSVRGYAFNSLGVQQLGATVGGRVLAVLSAEAVYQLSPGFGLALFHDAGNAADRWQDFHLLQASGIGGRWFTPVGAIKLDLAFARATRHPRLHFSVGYGF